ncbi:Z1 domain-containing protein [Rossellomorea marisflavi]|uniref:Z1 domain-containing protein n=1 Tax=Rossellomorea marisflavi TaxID=189381 RepID=UPI00064ECE1B|nr:Z1 domain-containing protein [Rossellomorea marisflavi]KML03178.1 hypothetical protein VL06_16215 [Rossellomorea marisflavi]
MKNNNMYSAVLKIISSKLSEREGVLFQSDITDQIREWRKFIYSSPSSTIELILSIKTEDIVELSLDEWALLQKELESSFIVRIQKGILVKGNEQRKRDTSWWTHVKKPETERYYSNNYFEYMKQSIPRNVLDTIDEDTDVIMNNLEDPSSASYSIKGLVVGQVQSGKTSNYASLICKAADVGYRFIVVIAGAQTILRNQTQARLEEVFLGANNKGVAKLPNFKLGKVPHCPTLGKQDFKKDIALSQYSTNFENNRSPIVLVIKKHTNPLDNLLEWLNDTYPNKINEPMLIIDDESDYASVNTKKETDPTAINKRIRLLINKFNKSAYVAYTATPFANIFVDHKASNDSFGDDLFPNDFIYALNSPDNYFGPDIIFGGEDSDEDSKFIEEIPDEEVVFQEEKDEEGNLIPEERFVIKHKKDYQINELPYSLYEAISRFILNIGIRNLRNQRDKHNSMLIHISRYTDVHIQIKGHVKPYIDDIKKDITSYGKLGIISTPKLQLLKKVYDQKLNNIEFTFENILKELADSIESLQVIDVHQKMKSPLVYHDDAQTNAIVIGGLSIARGFTLEGLSISYFLRTTFYYDTLMQMGRWFGYRMGYQDLCRIYITNEMKNKFSFINTAMDELLQKLQIMRKEGLTPEDFGLAVKQHPDSLVQITARNKAKYTESMYINMDLNGTIKETSFIDKKEASIYENFKVIKSFISLLKEKYTLTKDDHFIVKNIESKYIKQFVNDYRFYPKDSLGLKSRMPIAFIKKYLEENLLAWDVVIYNGQSEHKFIHEDIKVKYQKRKVKKNEDSYEFNKSQVARAKAESILVDKKYKKMKASEMRMHLQNPVLFIHLFEAEIIGEKEKKLSGLSFSFPGIAINKPTKVMINTVMKSELLSVATENSYEEELFDDE